MNMQTPTPEMGFLETANAIGAQLSRDALWDGSRCNWLGSSMEPIGTAWTVVQRSFGPDLYGGTSGIALFVARLYEFTQEPIHRKTAEGAINQALSRAATDFAPTSRIAFHSGLTGLAYMLIEAGRIFEREDLVVHGLKTLHDLSGEDMSQQDTDIIAGCAGAIPALLAIHAHHRQEFLLDTAVALGEQLLQRAEKREEGWSWSTIGAPALRNLTGFAHGTAGIAHALLELHHVTSDERFKEGADQAFRYEQAWFSPEHGNWPDFRSMDGAPPSPNAPLSYGVAWCHGAPGIGLSRLRAYSLLRDPARLTEAQVALQTTIGALNPAIPGWTNFSLCHGFAGNSDLLIYASQVLGSQDYLTVARQVGSAGIAQYAVRNIPWPCGVYGGGENPSLMLGIAGTGHFYLRLHDPGRVPSVLILLPDSVSGSERGRNE